MNHDEMLEHMQRIKAGLDDDLKELGTVDQDVLDILRAQFFSGLRKAIDELCERSLAAAKEGGFYELACCYLGYVMSVLKAEADEIGIKKILDSARANGKYKDMAWVLGVFADLRVTLQSLEGEEDLTPYDVITIYLGEDHDFPREESTWQKIINDCTETIARAALILTLLTGEGSRIKSITASSLSVLAHAFKTEIESPDVQFISAYAFAVRINSRLRSEMQNVYNRTREVLSNTASN